MKPGDIEAAARALYDACQTVKPSWEQLGDVTRGVWRERVMKPAPVAPKPKGKKA